CENGRAVSLVAACSVRRDSPAVREGNKGTAATGPRAQEILSVSGGEVHVKTERKPRLFPLPDLILPTQNHISNTRSRVLLKERSLRRRIRRCELVDQETRFEAGNDGAGRHPHAYIENRNCHRKVESVGHTESNDTRELM